MADWFRVHSFPLEQDLQVLVDFFRARQVPHRITEEAGHQSLWVPNEQLALQLREWLEQDDLLENLASQQFQNNEPPEQHADSFQTNSSPAGIGLKFLLQILRYPVTMLTLLLGIAGALLVHFDKSGQLIALFTFQPFEVVNGQIVFLPLQDGFDHGQYWRVLTPIFLHFGALHIIFNGLWIWEFGRRMEARFGSGALMASIVLLGVGSNMAQSWWAGASLFGGLSGVLYGLMATLWLHHRFKPHPITALPNGVVGFMLVWMVLCMTGVVTVFSGTGVANAAHFGGFVLGLLLAGLMYVLSDEPPPQKKQA